MDAHRVNILNRADDDKVVTRSRIDFQLKLFHPSTDSSTSTVRQSGFFVDTALHELPVELFGVVRDTAATTAQRKRRANQHRETERLDKCLRLANGTHYIGARRR